MDLQDQLKNLFPDHVPEETEEQLEESNIWLQDDPIICKYEKRKGKPITILEGYTGADEDFKLLAKELKQKLSVGGSFNKRNRPINQVSAIEIVNTESKIESANFIRSNFSSAVLFDQLEDLHNYIITQINKEGLILEFGVYTARSTKRFSKKLVNLNDRRTIYGFDSFEGLEDNWGGQFRASKGSFKVKPPRVPSNVELIIGPAQETLETFLNQHKHEKIASYWEDIHRFELEEDGD